MDKEYTYLDYEYKQELERLSKLKELCKDYNITLQDFLLNKIADDLEKIRIVQEKE